MNRNKAPLCVLFLGLFPGGAMADPATGPIPPAAMIRSLKEFDHKADSLSGALAMWPAKRAAAGAVCVSDSTGLCAEDRDKLRALFSEGRGLGRYLQARGGGSFLAKDAYADTLLPMAREFGKHKLELSVGAIRNPVTQAFDAAFVESISTPVLLRRFVDLTIPSRILMERKYFSGDEGNFLEGNLNGHLPFTRTDPDPTRADYGISPWEFLFRFEPLYLIRDPDPENLGLLLDLGLLRHIFPTVGADASVDESFWSEWVRRTGFKLGGGFYGSEPAWVAGGGIQIAFLSGWCLYDFRHEETRFALGLSNLAWFQKLLPFLGKP